MASYSKGLSSEIALDLSRIFGKATRRQLKLAGKPFQRIVGSYKENLISPADRANLNNRIAATMRESILEAYKTNVLAVRSAPAYRTQDPKRHSGDLLHFLEGSESYVVGSSDDIIFNLAPMTAAAEQWGRLNFGASPGEGYSGIHFPAISVRIQFGKNQGVSYELPGVQGSGFRVPDGKARSGYFNENGQFFIGYPKAAEGEKRDRANEIILRKQPSSGIGARHFVDAGLLALRENFKPFYAQFFEDAVRKTKAQEL